MSLGALKKKIDRGLELAHHDFCPGLNKYVYWLKTPIGWVVMSAFCSLLIGLFVGPQGYVMLLSAIAILVLGISWPWLSLKRIHCKLTISKKRSDEKQVIRVSLEVENRWPIPIFGLFVQGDFLNEFKVVDGDDDEKIEVALQRLPAWSRTQFHWEVVPVRRGSFPASTPVIATGFPFGIYQSRKQVEITDTSIVWPAVEFDHNVVPPVGALAGHSDSFGELAGNDGETLGVREYRIGDKIKSIHWSRSARFNKLFVRERQSPTRATVRVILDLNSERHSSNNESGTYELAIRTAAMICRQLHLHRIPVELICPGLENERDERISNARGLEMILDYLALLPEINDFYESNASPTEASSFPLSTAGQNTILVGTPDSMKVLPKLTRFQQVVVDRTGKIRCIDAAIQGKAIPAPLMTGDSNQTEPSFPTTLRAAV